MYALISYNLKRVHLNINKIYKKDMSSTSIKSLIDAFKFFVELKILGSYK